MNAEKFYPSPPTEIVSEPVLRRKICVEVKHENQQDVQKAVKRMRGKREGTHDCDPKLPSFQPAKRSSIYRGVSRHRWTGRYEAHLWDKSSWNETRNKKGRQVYLGAYIEEEVAARTYDLAALKYWGPAGTVINFPLSDYVKDLEAMENITREEYLASLRRSSGFSRGLSKYRGVARHHQNDRWEARIGRVFGNKYLYLGTYSTQEEATTAYDMAAIEYRGLNAVTNFDLKSYLRGLRPTNIINRSSNTAENVETKSYEESMKCQSYTKRIESRNTCFMPCPSPRSSSSAVNTKGIKPSSTTALDLLLQSSRFKKMVQETSFENPDFGWDTKHLKSNGSADVIFSANQSNSDFPLRIVQNIESNVFPYYHEKVDDLFTCISNAQFQLVEQKHVSLDEEVCFAY